MIYREKISMRNFNFTTFLVIVSMVTVMTSCSRDNQGDQRLSDVAKIDISAQNANLKTRAEDMEADLSRRQGFYQGVKGQFEGSFVSSIGALKIRITLVPSVTPISSDRIRLPEEITADLNQLSFHVQILQWDPSNSLSASGCRVEGVKPDLISGKIQIVSKDCANIYLISITDPSLVTAPQIQSVKEYYEFSSTEIAPELAKKLFLGSENSIPEITGSIQMTTNAETYYFKAKRLEKSGVNR